MLWCSCSLWLRIRSWFRTYERLQALAVNLIYIQIGCSLLGSLGASHNGVLLINLPVALFALVAIESSSEALGRIYAVLLFCAILVDIAWFILFSHSLWNIDPEKYDPFVVFSLRLALSMQIIGFSMRFLSSFLWIQMYRLGIPREHTAGAYREADSDAGNSYVSLPSHGIQRQKSKSDEILGGSIYDPAYFSSLFEDARDKRGFREAGQQMIFSDHGSASSIEASPLRSSVSRSFQVNDDDVILEI